MVSMRGRPVVLGITGSIAAYKALGLIRALRGEGCEVHPVLTEGGQRFVTPLSASALAGRAAITDLWSAAARGEIGHVELAHHAAAVVVAPASAGALGRLARGETQCPLGALALACSAPLLLAPAMETQMWEHPATQASVAQLRARGAHLVAPERGALASGRDGVGRLASEARVLEALYRALSAGDLRGQRILITAGATREALDPARYFSNAATGKMGFALARAALRRGAEVELVAGHVAALPPPGAALTHVSTTAEMLAACRAAAPSCGVLIMAAAPADFRPLAPQAHKLKKRAVGGEMTVRLAATEDVLARLRAVPGPRLTVGFAAETEQHLQNGCDKLAQKGCDLLVVNPLGVADAGFASDDNRGWLLRPRGAPVELPQSSKLAMAETILDHVAGALAAA